MRLQLRPRKSFILFFGALAIVFAPISYADFPLTTTFMYQGRLLESGVPANGPYSFKFQLFDGSTGGNQIGSTISIVGVSVEDGLFSVALDFGDVYDGRGRWLQITVGGTVLSGRQPLFATPYASYAMKPWSPATGGIAYSDGNVGIGTDTPQNPLHIVLRDTSGVAADSTSGVVIDNNGVAYMSILTPDDREGGVLFGEPTKGRFAGSMLFNTIDHRSGFEFRCNGNQTKMVIDSTGRVGLGTSTPENTLHISNGDAGSVTASAAAPLVVESDSNTFINILSPDANVRGILFGAPTDGALAGGIYYNSSGTKDGLQFRVNGNQTALVVGSNGFVGIGTTNPDTPLDVKRNQNPPASFDRTGNDGAVVAIQQDGTTEGTISVSGNTVSYNAFTGSHFAWTDQPIARGTLVAMTGENRRFHDQMTSEIIYGIAVTNRANEPACLGAFLGTLDASYPPGSDNPDLVMAVGNGDMWVVDDGRGNIHPGDYLIASEAAGCAMLDDSERFAVGHIVARAAEPVEWSTVSPGVDGIRRARTSVLFENFDRHLSVSRFEQFVERQQRENDELRARVTRLEQLLRAATPADGSRNQVRPPLGR